MSNGFYTEKAAINSLNLLKNILERDEENEYKKQQSQGIYLGKQIESVDTIEGLNNLLPAVKSHNEQAKYSGNDELYLNVESKLDAYKANKLAYENAHKYQDLVFASTPDEIAKEMLSGGWEKYTETMLDIYSLKDAMTKGKELKFRYTPQGKYNQKTLDKSLDKMEDIALSALEVFDDYEGDFNATNPDGTIDEESRILFDKLKLDIALGNTSEIKSTMNAGISSSISRYNQAIRQYNTYSKMEMKQFPSDKTVGQAAGEMGDLEEEILAMAGAQGYGSNDYIDSEFISDMKQQGLENAKKANRRHKAYTGVLYDKNPIYERLGIDDEDFADMGVSGASFSIDDLNKNQDQDPLLKEILDTSELKEDKKTEDVSPLEETPKPPISGVAPPVGSIEYKKRQQFPPATKEMSEEDKMRQEYDNYVMDAEKIDISYDDFKGIYKAQKDFDTKEYEYQGWNREYEPPFLLKDEYKFVNTYKLQEIPSIGYFFSKEGNRLNIDEISKKDPELLVKNLNQVLKDKRFFGGVAYGQKSGWRLKKDIKSISNLIKKYKQGIKTIGGDIPIERAIMKSYNRMMDNFMGFARDVGFNRIQTTRGLLN